MITRRLCLGVVSLLVIAGTVAAGGHTPPTGGVQSTKNSTLSPTTGTAVGLPGVSLAGRTIRVGLPEPRMVRGMLHGTAQNPQGFLREVALAALEHAGAKVEFVPYDAEGLREGLEELRQGRIDVVSGLMVSEPRLSEFLFSTPVMISSGVVVYRKELGFTPVGLDCLKDLRVVVPHGGTGQQHAAEHRLPVSTAPTLVEALRRVQAGEADACITTMAAANREIEVSNHDNLRVAELKREGFWRAFAYAVRHKDTQLMAGLNAGLAQLRNDGRFDALYQAEVESYQPLQKPRTVQLTEVMRWGAWALLALAVGVVYWQWRQRRRVNGVLQRLADSEQRYRGIFDHSQDAIFTLDPESQTIIEVNPSTARMYGYNIDAFRGMPISRIVVDASVIPASIKRVLEQGPIAKTRSVHRHQSGRLIHVEIAAASAVIGGRTVIVTINRDVTKTAQAEELIRAVIAESPHVAIQGFDRDGVVKFWNAASRNLYGWSEQHAVGKRMGELLGDSVSHDALVELLARIERQGKPSGVMEFRVTTSDGSSKWVLSEITYAPGTEGSPLFVCVDIDITAIKAAQHQLQDAQARLASALQAAGTGTWSIDVASKTLSPDPSLLSLYELDTGDTRDRSLSDLALRIHPEDSPRVLQAVTSAMKGENNYSAEYRLVLADGRTRWLSSRGRPLRDESGQVVAISGACTDITEAKAAAAEADRLRDQLERARRLESLGLLAGGLAHDFNNLLVGIRGNTELALNALPVEGAATHALRRVVEATDLTADLTNQLLASAGRSRLALEPASVNALVERCVQVIGPRMGPSLRVVTPCSLDEIITLADPGHLCQAINNLLANAADASPPQGGQIEVESAVVELSEADFADPSFKVTSRPGRYVSIAVRDHGSGMDETVMARVFEPFYTTKASGRGLGLSLVQMTARRHEGAVRVKSVAGGGTTFTLYLPLRSPPLPVHEPVLPSNLLKPGRALVVDDQPMVRSVVAGMLAAAGWSVVEAESGEHAAESARADTFEIAFIDLTMPGMSGVQTAAALRSVTPSTAIVLMSGYNRDFASGEGGLADEVFVQKPFNSQTLLAAASIAMERSRQAGGRLTAGTP